MLGPAMANLEQTPYCLVLGGGGAKGVYHIGVWQALKTLGIPVNAFIGNSIGAIMAAFLAQGAEDALLDIAESINLSSLIRLNKDKALADEQSFLDHSLSYWQGVYKNLVEKRGLDTTPMREILEANLDEDAIRNSGVDFGVTTVNLTDFKPREVFIDVMEPGQLVNYVMASAAFPGFSQPKIEGKKYIDGGLYDNVPFTMAKRRGYRKIILVDISGIGLSRRAQTEGTQTVYIKNSIDMGSAFDFDPDFIQTYWKLGELDTLKAFEQLVGDQYFVEPNPKAEASFHQEPFIPLLKRYPDSTKHDPRLLLRTLEVCASLFDIERIERYSYTSLQEAIVNRAQQTDAELESLLQEHGLNAEARSSKIFDAFVREVMENKKRDDHPYFYLRLIQRFESSTALSLLEKGVRKLNPELRILEHFLEQAVF